MRDYERVLSNILRELYTGNGMDLTAPYHFVRRIPYGSTGQRDPLIVYETNQGSCSGKHILLRDLLRAVGLEANIITILTHFNKRIPIHESMPGQLIDIIANEEVPDYHHFVRTKDTAGHLVDLDATWHDRLIAYGFPVNMRWDGFGDTELAGQPIQEFPIHEDIPNQKVQLLRQLSGKELQLREDFLTLLSDWFATID